MSKQTKYNELKIKIFRNTLLMTVLAGITIFFIFNLLIDGILQDPFAEFFIRTLRHMFGMTRDEAIEWYKVIFRRNKTLYVLFGFISMFAVYFYIGMSKFSKYFDEVGNGIDSIIDPASGRIVLSHELEPIEKKLNRIQDTIELKEKQAKLSEERKNDLVLYLAHDLKTPLTSIIAYLTMLRDNPDMDTEKRAKCVNISLEKANRLNELIKEFFEITCYNVADMKIEKQEINLSMMLSQITDEFYPLLYPKNMTFKTDIEDDIIINADPDRLARVFDNLLRNAIAYSYENTAIIVKAVHIGGRVMITFSNKGDDIKKEQLDSLFDKFFRLDSSRSSATGGSGLGLAIAKEIVNRHDGTITASCVDGQTTFLVVIPVA